MRSIWTAGLVALTLLWFGMLLGVDFVAVPAQFAAPGLTRPQGIDVTRQVFAALSQIELGLAVASLVLALLVRPGRLLWAMLGLVWLIVVAQGFWLLPALDARADLLLQGQEPAPGPWHGLYVGAEMTKLALLLLVAWRASRRPAA